MVDNTYYNHGLEQAMVEQDVFIEVLRNLPRVANFFNAGASYTPYVSFVLELTSHYIRAPNLVRYLLFCH